MSDQIDVDGDREELKRLFPYMQQYQQLAKKHNINDIFQDNGGKYLELQIILGLTTDGKREGNDAVDANGKEYEIKTVNMDLRQEFTTHHHLNKTIIEKYRPVDWYFAVYKNIELQAIYQMAPDAMQKYYDKWTAQLESGKEHINNPKIPLKEVMRDGKVVWLPAGKDEFVLPLKERTPRKPKA